MHRNVMGFGKTGKLQHLNNAPTENRTGKAILSLLIRQNRLFLQQGRVKIPRPQLTIIYTVD